MEVHVIEEVIASRDLRLMKNKVEVFGVPNVFYDPLNFRLVIITESPIAVKAEEEPLKAVPDSKALVPYGYMPSKRAGKRESKWKK